VIFASWKQVEVSLVMTKAVEEIDRRSVDVATKGEDDFAIDDVEFLQYCLKL
jgi:hypothetical protein